MNMHIPAHAYENTDIPVCMSESCPTIQLVLFLWRSSRMGSLHDVVAIVMMG